MSMSNSKHRNQRRELDVGIELRLSTSERFLGSIKERYSDFHVNEIDPSGKIVQLTSYNLPESAKTEIILGPELSNFISEEIREKIEDLVSNANGSSESAPVEINVTDLDKVNRTKVHRFIQQFPSLQGETITKENDKFIKVYVPAKNDKQLSRRPHNRAKFTHCVLYKEGIDTSDAISYLSRKLRLESKHISYAGTKDKQAKTSQRICFSNVDASRLAKINEYSTNSKLGNFSYQNKNLHLGELNGNYFKILIKNVEGTDEVIKSSIESLQQNGFLNYFGLQRFGTYKVPTFQIGKSLLQNNWMKAFDLILAPNDHDAEFMKKAKSLWLHERNASASVSLIPHFHKSIPASLLRSLAANEGSPSLLQSFLSIPRNNRSLYFHSFQSYLFNKLLSYRLSNFPHSLLPGDLVVLPTHQLNEVYNLNESSEEFVRICPKILTEADVGNYVFSDLVLPLEGSDVKMSPSNPLYSFYENLCREEGFEAGGIWSKLNIKSEVPRGSYRRVVCKLYQLEFDIFNYGAESNLDKLIPSDLDLMDKEFKEIDIRQLVGDKKGICLKFSIPSSSYATMALREILETERNEFDKSLDDETTKKEDICDNSSDKNSTEPEQEIKRIKLEI